MWSDLPQRLATICIGVPILLVFWSHDVTRWIFFQGLHMALAVEYVRLTKIPWLYGVSFGVASLILLHVPTMELFLLVWVTFTALLALVQAGHAKTTSAYSEAITVGWIWIVIPCRSLLYISNTGFRHVVTLLLTAWNADTGALIVGRAVASQPMKMLRYISPKKTLPGLIGAVFGGVMTYVCLMDARWRWLGDPPTNRPGIPPAWVNGVALSLLGILGDLFESSLKRKYQQKDSSKLLPGHGGILDRFDSVMMAALYYHVILRRSNA